MQFFYVCILEYISLLYTILALMLLFFYQYNQQSAFKRSAIAFASSLA